MKPISNNPQIEETTLEIGRRLLLETRSQSKSIFSRDRWQSKFMQWCMTNPDLKINLLRLVETFPVLKSNDEIVAHLFEFFPDEKDLPPFFRMGLALGSGGKLGKFALGTAVKTAIQLMAQSFIPASNPKDAIELTQKMKNEGLLYSLDILGEYTTSEKQAENYTQQYIQLIESLGQAQTKGNIPINISVKPSALSSQFSSLNYSELQRSMVPRLKKILQAAQHHNAFVNLDMERFRVRDLTEKIFAALVLDPDLKNYPHIGIVVQAYLKDSESHLHHLIKISASRPVPFQIRLVKGAYWDYETVTAIQNHWPVPVYSRKWQTDVNFETLTGILLTQHQYIRTAIGSHNIRSIAYTLALADSLRVPAEAFEFQVLYGMGEDIASALIKVNKTVRVYTPYGDPVPGMAYLVRRILENSSQESFILQSTQQKKDDRELLKNPVQPEQDTSVVSSPVFSEKKFSNIADIDFSKFENIELQSQKLREIREQFGRSYPLIINNETVKTNEWMDSLNPARPQEIIGKIAKATPPQAESAIASARVAFPLWSALSSRERANYLFKAAQIMQSRRSELTAWIIYETGKAWAESDADVSEAIDFLNYYSCEVIRLGDFFSMFQVPGETNDYHYTGRGVGIVISPWNFPLAIITGMSSAALAAGNSIIIKPATQSAVVASKLMEIYLDAGLPPGVVNFLPGPGGKTGEHLVQHKDSAFVIFTGSKEVGLRINQLASQQQSGQRFVKKVVAEMGGKNAIIVDNDADLDEAIIGTLSSAFGFQGQKCSACSRVIVLENLYTAFVERLIDSAKDIPIGLPEDPHFIIGPLIDKNAQQRTLQYIEQGKKEARLMLQGSIPERCQQGFYVSPTIFSDVPPHAVIAQEEIFGPVLSVIKARSLDEALTIANDSEFGLTGGIFTRSPSSIKKAINQMQVGNLYINRKITGAVVGRQPFGGFKMSGIGSKAGGPDYLLQFMIPRTVTENILRQGYAPIDPSLLE